MARTATRPPVAGSQYSRAQSHDTKTAPYSKSVPPQQKQKRKRKRKTRTEVSSDSDSSSDSSDSSDDEVVKKVPEVVKSKSEKNKIPAPVVTAVATKEVVMAEADDEGSNEEDSDDDNSSAESSDEDVAEAGKNTQTAHSASKEFEKSGMIPKPLQTLHEPSPPPDATAVKFEEYYMKLLTAEFGDDLNSIRQAKDFNAERSLPMLVKALKSGVQEFSEAEKQTVLGEAQEN